MTASLQVCKKDNKYYVHLSWKQNGKRRQKCIGTGLSAKGNNHRTAERTMREILNEWQEKVVEDSVDVLFSDYMGTWIEDIRYTLAESTYHNYKIVIDGVIRPYFDEKGITLTALSARDIQNFYAEKLRQGISPNTIHHYHSYIHSALKYAMTLGQIKQNPSDLVKLPKKKRHIATAHSVEEIRELISGAYGSPIEVPITIAAMFGTRRGEVLGLKWENIDLDHKTMFVGSVISKSNREFYKDTPKNDASIRCFPLTDDEVLFFKNLKERQDENRLAHPGHYNNADSEYVCVDEFGNRLKLDYVTRCVPRLSTQLGIGRIKMHELRHTNISLLIDSGATIKEVQEWAGHSSASTTANIYGHTMGEYKKRLSATVENALSKDLVR